LTQDLHELYKTVIDGYQTGELEAASDMQLDWHAHALWILYKDIVKFFKKQFTEDDLHQGYHMKNPLMDYIQEISRFTSMYSSGVPPCLLVQTKQLATKETRLGSKQKQKCPGGPNRKPPKKLKTLKGKLQWKDNIFLIQC